MQTTMCKHQSRRMGLVNLLIAKIGDTAANDGYLGQRISNHQATDELPFPDKPADGFNLFYGLPSVRH